MSHFRGLMWMGPGAWEVGCQSKDGRGVRFRLWRGGGEGREGEEGKREENTNLFSLRLNQCGILEKAKSISNVNLFQ